ncbi:MAG TPA: 1-deoxy-D-xylulose-5-phosphate reductoisomerase, partial [Nitrosomonas sp.]|nr:1-deoxy-D-xylulose-5-phosphate reductoisomerase [Nitrosomonas sp.]
MNNIRQITILGSTGSIGESTLDVIGRHPDRFQAFALTANNNVAKMLEQC